MITLITKLDHSQSPCTHTLSSTIIPKTLGISPSACSPMMIEHVHVHVHVATCTFACGCVYTCMSMCTNSMWSYSLAPKLLGEEGKVLTACVCS